MRHTIVVVESIVSTGRDDENALVVEDTDENEQSDSKKATDQLSCDTKNSIEDTYLSPDTASTNNQGQTHQISTDSLQCKMDSQVAQQLVSARFNEQREYITKERLQAKRKIGSYRQRR